MKKTYFLLILWLFFISSCATRLIPVEDLITKEAKGIIIKVGKQKITFYKDDLYTPVYVRIINNTEKKIKLNFTDFMMADDKNNQFSSVPFQKVLDLYEKKKEKNDKYGCPPNCNPNQVPYYGNYNYPYGAFNTVGISNRYLPPFYPYFSSDPFMYYKDKDGNFKALPPSYTQPYYPAYPPPETIEEDPSLMALRMEEIFPHFQIQGYIYFHQAARHAEKKVKLLIRIPGDTDNNTPLEFEFFVK